jgi:hypothetical protein
MATTSEVKAGLDDIATSIRNCRQAFINSKARIQTAHSELVSIPTTFSDVLSTINNYTGTDEFEVLCQAEKAKLTTEFQALRDEINTLIAEF